MRAGDVLVVWKLDRLARSLKQLIETIETLEKQDKGFRSLTEVIDTTSSGGRFFFHIFGALAEFEKSINSRIKSCEKIRENRGKTKSLKTR